LSTRLTPRARQRPDRPGPGLMSDSLLRALDVTIKRRIDGLLQGDFRSFHLGAGLEFAQVREYVPGDDVRRIDWNVTARTGNVHVRVHVAERNLTTWVLLDSSASMHFGTQERRKFDVAEGVVLAASHIGTRGANKVGIMTFGAKEDHVLPARQSGVPVVQLLSKLHDDEVPDGPGTTSLPTALERAAKRVRAGGLVLVVSDWPSDLKWERPLRLLMQHHHVLAIEVRDRREMELENIGETIFVDFETGKQVRVDTGDSALRRRFAEAVAADRDRVARVIRATGAEHCVLDTSGDWLRRLATFLSEGKMLRR
jgi:uncharacterized protein (DUF58 family)